MDPYEPPISRQLIKGNYVEESTGNRQTHLDLLNNDHVIKHQTQEPIQAIDAIPAEKDIISRNRRNTYKYDDKKKGVANEDNYGPTTKIYWEDHHL